MCFFCQNVDAVDEELNEDRLGHWIFFYWIPEYFFFFQSQNGLKDKMK